MDQVNPYSPPEAQVSDVPEVNAGELASRWQRLGGSIVDGLIQSAFVLPVMYFAGTWGAALKGQKVTLTMTLVLAAYGVLVYLLVNGYFLKTRGQTVGKIAVGTRIVDVRSEQTPSLGKLLGLRFLPVALISQIPYVGSVLALVDSLFVFREDHRCLHDFLAGTKVVRVGKVASATPAV